MAHAYRASVLHGPKDLRLENRILNAPGPTELQIAIRATSLCGSDLHYYRHYRNGDIQVQEPLSLGHQSAGVVAAIGSGVDSFKIGDRVALEVGLPCGECERCREGRYNICTAMRFRSSAKSYPHFQGTLQDRINHPAAWCHKLPDNVSFGVGALLEPLSVAIQSTRRAEVSDGDLILVLGAGAIGLLCAAVSKEFGSRQVVIADIQQERVAFATKHGFATSGITIPLSRGRSIEEKLAIAKEAAALACQSLTTETASEAAFDVVLECTGVEACTQAAIYAARPGGKVVLVGMGNPIQTLPISAAAIREIDIRGTFRYANTYCQAIQLVAGRDSALPDLTQLITHRYYGLTETHRAFETAGATHDQQGHIVIKVLLETS